MKHSDKLRNGCSQFIATSTNPQEERHGPAHLQHAVQKPASETVCGALACTASWETWKFVEAPLLLNARFVGFGRTFVAK